MENLEDSVINLERSFTASNPKSRKYCEGASVSLPGGLTNDGHYYRPFPLIMSRAEGCYFWDLDGHRYTDWLGNWTVGLYGHGNPIIISAVTEALQTRGAGGAPGVNDSQLAVELVARYPSFERVLFCTSGSEACLYALSTARAISGRTKIMVFSGSYHAGLFYFNNNKEGALNVPFPTVLATYNDVHEVLELVAEHKKELAAIIVEPMLAGGGSIPADQPFLAALRKCTSEHEILLIFDEVVTGRLGPAGLQGHYEITPDLTVLGKWLAGGFAFGVFGGRAEIMEEFDPKRIGGLSHFGSAVNNGAAVAAALAGLTHLYPVHVAKRLSERGDALRTKLNKIIQQYGVLMQVTGLGSIMQVHFTQQPIRSPRDLRVENKELIRLFHLGMIERGQHVAKSGRVTLSLPMGDDEITAFIGSFQAFLSDYRHLLQIES
jgi:glutamate-1-semialdehyde 2,1-aminomutase